MKPPNKPTLQLTFDWKEYDARMRLLEHLFRDETKLSPAQFQRIQVAAMFDLAFSATRAIEGDNPTQSTYRLPFDSGAVLQAKSDLLALFESSADGAANWLKADGLKGGRQSKVSYLSHHKAFLAGLTCFVSHVIDRSEHTAASWVADELSRGGYEEVSPKAILGWIEAFRSSKQPRIREMFDAGKEGCYLGSCLPRSVAQTAGDRKQFRGVLATFCKEILKILEPPTS